MAVVAQPVARVVRVAEAAAVHPVLLAAAEVSAPVVDPAAVDAVPPRVRSAAVARPARDASRVGQSARNWSR